MPPSPERTPAQAAGRTAVLYIGGFTRSGSTLLSYLLAGDPRMRSVGELREVWRKGVIEDSLCSCGQPFSACDFWSAVGERAFGGWERVDAAALAASAQAVGGDERLIGALATGRLTPRLRTLREHAIELYRALADGEGVTIVDSSKLAPYALLLAGAEGLDLRVIHLVRDSRGVAFSWAKQGVRKPDAPTGRAVMETYGPRATALRWSYHNALFAIFPGRSIPLSRLRYERLVEEPSAAVTGGVARLGLEYRPDSAAGAAPGAVSLAGAHTIGGNPMRFAGREQAVRIDDEWRRSMPAGERRLVTALSWPLLARYGYLKRR